MQPRPTPHIVGQRRQQQAREGGGITHLLTGKSVEPTCRRL
jgi:hypothetical protein